MKPIRICLALILMAMSAAAEMRTWTASNGQSFVGEFVSVDGGKVALKGQNGKTIKVPIAGLSQEDQDYIDLNRPLDLNIKVEMISPDYQPFCNLKIEVQNRERREIDKPIDCYSFVFDGDDNLVMSSCSKSLHINTNGAYVHDPDSAATGFNKKDYDDYLIVLVDSANTIVACESSSPKPKKDAELQRKLFMAEKWRSYLPPLLKDNSNSGDEILNFRFLDCSTIITTNKEGRVTRSTRAMGYGSSQNDMEYRTFVESLNAFADSGFNESEMPSYYRTTARLSTVLFPFASVKQIPALTLIAPPPKKNDEYKMFPYFARRNLSHPQDVRLPPLWFMHTAGWIQHDGNITFRFVGQGNCTHFVGLDGKIVLSSEMTELERIRADLPPYILPGILPIPDEPSHLYAGEWITMEKGVSKQLDVVIAPPKKGPFTAMLFVQVSGRKYGTNEAGGPILPLFCAGPVPSEDFIHTVYGAVCPEGMKPPEPVSFKIVASKEADE